MSDDLFDLILHDCTIGGITLPVSSRTINGGRALARRRYPNRDGQSTEDMGREPYGFRLTIPLYAGVNSEHYPRTQNQLRLMLDDPDFRGDLEYVDIELGALDAKVISWSWEQDAKQRDGGTFTIALEEVTFEALLLTSGPGMMLRRDSGREMDDLMAELGIPESDVLAAWEESGVGFGIDYNDGELMFTWVDNVLTDAAELAARADELATTVDRFRTQTDAILALPALADAATWSLRSACVSTKDSVAQMVEAASLVTEWVLSRPMSAWEISLELFGDADHADEIIADNPTPNPMFYPAEYVVVTASTQIVTSASVTMAV